ncbi:DUF2095 domain-containing protein [Candidatus Bathyarchaeota archaeon]|jgi:hypothetical protein|nr:MAG: DUF2095 domain-containing protein [Candidatus Bathyarchaeota archaeon]
MEKEELRKKYPKLIEELETGTGKADIQFEVEKPKPKRKFAGYNPNVIDFIRRCTNDTQALEIIEYMKNREEISFEEAEKLCKQLEEEGLRSFGRKKEHGYYEREG